MTILQSTTLDSRPPRPTLLGFRRSAIIEIALMLGALLLLDALALDGARYWSANPHPFWFVVLFLACQYGTKEGLLAAAASSVALLLGNMPEQSLAQDGYAYLFSVVKLPLLWLVSGVIFGELRQMHIRDRGDLETSLAESYEREQRISQSYQWVRQVKEQFEVRVAGQMRSSVAAYQAARSMGDLSPQQALQGCEELIRATLNPQQFSIYLLGDKGADVALMHGWPDAASYRRSLGGDDPLYRAVIGERRTLLVARPQDETTLGGQGLLAAPLVDSDSGEVVGLMKIEKMSFTDLHLTNVEAFSTIGQWAGKAVVNARRYQTAKEGSLINPDHRLFTRSYFARFGDYITSLAKRLGFNVSMLTVKLADTEGLSADDRLRAARALAASVKAALRDIDLAFDHRENGEEYAVLLPATGMDGAGIVIGKIRAALEKQMPGESKRLQFLLSAEAMYEQKRAA